MFLISSIDKFKIANFFDYFMNRGAGYEAVLYLDPDISVFNRFDEMENALNGCDVLLTPHFTTPINDDKILSEEDILNTGLYNLGFICIRNYRC